MCDKCRLPFKLDVMIIGVVTGLIIWLAVPLFLKGKFKKSRFEAVAMTCKIIGMAVVVWTVLKHIMQVFP